MSEIKERYSARKLLKEVIPPIFLRGAKTLFNSIKPLIEGSGEKSKEWYDRAFDSYESHRKHYTEHSKLFLWSVIADRLMFAEIRSIVDIGCSSGQFSHLLYEKGFKEYCGIDFSRKRIEWAKKNCPQFTFISADVFETDIFEKMHYDAVICIEFMEHIERDIEVIKRIRKNTRFYGTVPNFPYTSHVRHFNNSKEVYDRYSKYFREFSITSFIADKKGKTFYLFQGIKI